MKLFVLPVFLLVCSSAYARSYDFKFYRNQEKSDPTSSSRTFENKVRSETYIVRVGTSAKCECVDPVEIRAATVLKHIKSKVSGINDIAVYKFDPNFQKPVRFKVSSGVASCTQDNMKYIGGDWSRGYVSGGVIIEFWQNGKCLKHWASCTGPICKTTLDENATQLLLEKDGYAAYSRERFKNGTLITVMDEIIPRERPSQESDAKQEGGKQKQSPEA